MANTEIKITFPEEKLEVLSFFMKKKNEDVEAVLKDHLDKAYEKVVPVPVREFVDNKMQTEAHNQEEPVAEPDNSEVREGQGRRNQRPDAAPRTGRRGQRNTEPEAGAAAIGEQQEETQAEEQEENQGMTMSM